MGQLRWIDFETNTCNVHIDFERLCRSFFKLWLFDKSTLFFQSPNQSGVEIEPIILDLKNTSFQAKYFTNRIDYQQIRDSMDAVFRNYKPGEIETIYLFCNLDFTLRGKAYMGIVEASKEHNITIIPVTNLSILDQISVNPVFSSLKEAFFGKHNLKHQWFIDITNISLSDLSGRYDKDFNVDVSIQKSLEYFFETKSAQNHAIVCMDKSIDYIRNLRYTNDEIKTSVISKIGKIKSLVARHLMHSIVSESVFTDEICAIEKIVTSIIEEQKQLQAGEDGKRSNRIKINSLQQTIRDYQELKSSINQLIDGSDEHPISVLQSRVLIIEGDAGAGKSQLVGFEANKNKIERRIILLLGQKLISETDPWSQIKSQLGIQSTIDDFFGALEGHGVVDNSPTIIIIDAINESAYYSIWKNYINLLITKVENYKFVKLIVTVRSSYKDLIFSSNIFDLIKSKKVINLTHLGFEENPRAAMLRYFQKFDIPLDTASYYPFEFSNPLLLRLFCESYDKNVVNQRITYESMFASLIIKENDHIKTLLQITDKYNYEKDILDETNIAMLRSHNNYITRKEINSLFAKNQDYIRVFNKMILGQVLISYRDSSGTEMIYYRYEKMADYMLAQRIIQKYKSIYSLRRFLIKKAANQRVGKYRISVGVCTAVFGQLHKYKNYKFAHALLKLPKNKYFEIPQVIQSIIDSHSIVESNRIDPKKFSHFISKAASIYEPSRVLNSAFSVLMINAAKETNPINAVFLVEHLLKYTLSDRDFYWTIYINEEFNHDFSRIKNTIDMILSDSWSCPETKRHLLALELTCFFTSSNRTLRDKASRALVKILTSHLEISLTVLSSFSKINDSYVLQRLLGCILGSVLTSPVSHISIPKYKELANLVYSIVFNKSPIYQEILIRDYAREIVEYGECLGISFDFDMSKVKPPYPEYKLPTLDTKRIRKDYKMGSQEAKDYRSASHLIAASMAPEGLNTQVGIGYGDFGRYIFQSGLQNFQNVAILDFYYYALSYIKDVLGFTDRFTDYDSHTYSYDRHNHVIERIGKKYQWMAAYHAWAIASDIHPLKKWYDSSSDRFNGPWAPYVRDFDPTLSLSNSDRIYTIDGFKGIPSQRFNSFSPNFNDWINNKKDVFAYEKVLELIDNNGIEWISLLFSETDRSNKSYEVDHQEVWREAGAFFCKKENETPYRELLMKQFFWGRWFYRRYSTYQLFSREYVWSPGYHDFYSDEFSDVEIPTGIFVTKSVETPRMPKFFIELEKKAAKKHVKEDGMKIVKEDGMKIYNVLEDSIEDVEECDTIEINIDDEMETEIIEQEVEVKNTIQVKKTWIEYVWEQEYDYSKDNGSVGYLIPSADIINYFGLVQMHDGLWYKDNTLVCADLSLVKDINREGLYIRKDYLLEFLKGNHYSIFWICLGEQNDVKKRGSFDILPESIFHDLSLFIYLENNKIVKTGMKFGNRENDDKNLTHYTELE